MAEDGYTISFVDESSCSFGESALQTYKIYDNNHLQILDVSKNAVMEFVFEVAEETLKIRLTTEDEYIVFTKNADEQKKILEKMQEIEAIALEEQRLQKEIDSVQAKIDSYMNDIEKVQGDIDWNNYAIENNKADIIKWEEAIEQEYINCQEAIEFGDDREYHENQRDDFIASYKESIQNCNERIVELEAENVRCRENIDLIIVEIEKLEKEIEKLKEQK